MHPDWLEEKRQRRQRDTFLIIISIFNAFRNLRRFFTDSLFTDRGKIFALLMSVWPFLHVRWLLWENISTAAVRKRSLCGCLMSLSLHCIHLSLHVVCELYSVCYVVAELLENALRPWWIGVPEKPTDPMQHGEGEFMVSLCTLFNNS